MAGILNVWYFKFVYVDTQKLCIYVKSNVSVFFFFTAYESHHVRKGLLPPRLNEIPPTWSPEITHSSGQAPRPGGGGGRLLHDQGNLFA